MGTLVDLGCRAVKSCLPILLQDKTTKKNIIWATDSYLFYGEEYSDKNQMTVEALVGLNPILIQPRITKTLSAQQERTKSHAEVFTPSWICNKMNNYCDEEWFGRKAVFNVEEEQSWKTVTEPILFNDESDWKKYIDSRRLEITCGEAPFIVSRYDASTGELIEVKNRIGVLDRKLRVVNENTQTKEDWFKWTLRTYQSTYGYEYQGDNLLIGRINLLMTFVDYYTARWAIEPDVAELKKIANVIAWNFWQMDGLTGTVPLGVPYEETEQLTLFGMMGMAQQEEEETPPCKVYDWRKGDSLLFSEIGKERL